ncbi:Acg family FMN-binding oxidoreductase [Saccharomonospora glauca]|uniref:Nitroreductase n=1 Tax=Saccharomonospora glauca K62 TaxID=928724 RepID=I1D3F2_9PSEU|nr:nitroreductase family protein [Saccharomonospora glauca]EIE99476.1 nitroreductase [Saccharomonospora glauca K62]
MTDTGTGTVADTLDATVAEALRAGTRAPSPHNTQPWMFVTRPGEIDVLLDDGRVLPVCDPDGREAVLSCGAAVLNIRLALARGGLACAVSVLPDRRRPELLATLRLGIGRAPSAADARLAEAIDARHTNRRPFEETPVPSAVRHALIRAAMDEGARLVLLADPAPFDAFAALVRRAEHTQRHDPEFAAELAEWTHQGERLDGVPLSAGGPRATDETALALRDFGGSEGKAAREFERQPLVAVLTTPGDTRRDAVRAGQALQRVLLTATASGVRASFLSQPLEVPHVRAELRTLLGGVYHPQAALRLGYGPPGAPTPRRDLDDVVLDGREDRKP